MKKKAIIYPLLTVITLLIILLIGIKLNTNTTKDTFHAEQLKYSSKNYYRISDKASQAISENGAFLLNTGKENLSYFILNATNISTNNEVPYYSDVKIESKDDTIEIHYNESQKNYSKDNSSELRLIYKIKSNTNTEYIKLFKNGEETHFASIIGG